MTHLDFFRKFKRLNPLEPSLGILGFGFFLATTLIFMACLFYSDYRAVKRRLRYAGVTWMGRITTGTSSPLPSSVGAELGGSENGWPGLLDASGDGCDIFDGNWVRDDSYTDCSFMDSGFRCLENGRPDSFYSKWLWQPSRCNLPRFDARLMLEKLRNRRLVFFGDSVGRNQWESLLCMLASVVPDNSSIYEVNGSPITKHRGFLAFMFKDYNFTIEYYRAPFLMHQGRPPAGAPKTAKMTIRVDVLDRTSPRWKKRRCACLQLWALVEL